MFSKAHIPMALLPAMCWAAMEPQTNQLRQAYFYVGGELTNITNGNITSQIKVGQMYVEKLTPRSVTQEHPIVFIAGVAQTGTNFLETPDGRPGWASLFLDQGFVVYLSDQPCRGRSPWHPSVGATGTEATSDAEQFFTATWENEYWPQARLHTQWPGTGKVGDPTFDAFYASQVQYLLDFAISESLSTKAYSALLDKIGAAHIVTHSQAGTFGWRIGDARPSLVKSIVALEPTSPPFDGPPLFPGKPRPWGLTYQEIVYEPSAGVDASLLDTVSVSAKDAQHSKCILQREPARKLKNLAKIPVLFVLGEASFLQPYGYCTVEYLRQAGVQVEFADLVEEGIRGNGHMLFLEKNNDEIAQRVWTWLLKQ